MYVTERSCPYITALNEGGGSSSGTQSTTSTTNSTTATAPQQVYNTQECQDAVNDAVSSELAILGLYPANDTIDIFSSTYTEGNFTCKKKDVFLGGTKIIKEENESWGKVLGDIFTGDKPERIIEEYDKKGKLTKKTYYKKDGSCVVTKYDDKGNISEEAVIINTKNDNDGYKTEITRTSYNKNGSYTIQTFSFEINENCENNKPIKTSDIACYDKHGNYDFLGTELTKSLQEYLDRVLDTNG